MPSGTYTNYVIKNQDSAAYIFDILKALKPQIMERNV